MMGGFLGSTLGGGGISGILNPEEPYKRSAEELFRQFEEAKKYILPFQQHGLEQYGTLQGGINSLLNPETLMNRFLSSYTESPYAKQLLSENQAQGLDAASSMGLMGSSAALQNIQKGAGNLTQSFREQYLKDLMNNYLKGLGLSQDIYGTGAKAAESLFGKGTEVGENLAGLRLGQERAPTDMFMNLLNLGARAAAGGGGGGAPGFLG